MRIIDLQTPGWLTHLSLIAFAGWTLLQGAVLPGIVFATGGLVVGVIRQLYREGRK